MRIICINLQNVLFKKNDEINVCFNFKETFTTEKLSFLYGGKCHNIENHYIVYCYFTVYYAQPIWNLPENGCFHFSHSYLEPPSRIFHKKVNFGKMEIKELFRMF